jgi:hypothetical protein
MFPESTIAPCKVVGHLWWLGYKHEKIAAASMTVTQRDSAQAKVGDTM